MKHLKEFDYIIENMSQARKILKDNDIDKDDERFKKIIDKTNRDGYTGFITQLVFEMGMNVGSALSFYDDLKEQSIDIGSPEIKKILDNNQSNNKKIQDILEIIRKKKDQKDFDLVLKSNGYDIYQIHNYEGALCTVSPAWCLKTKSFFDQYTKTRRGTQFVAVAEYMSGKEDNIFNKLKVPNTWNGNRYSNSTYATIRYGITIFPSGSMEVFDDDNTQIHVAGSGDKLVIRGDGNKETTLRHILVAIYDYWEENIKSEIDTSSVDGYDQFIDILEDAVERHRSWFSSMVSGGDSSQIYDDFIEDVLQLFDVDTKRGLFDIMDDFIDKILSDSYMTENCGVLDILLNEFVSSSGEFPQLEEFPGITKREIPLGGYWYDEQDTGDLVIKYNYGYQYDKYGKAAMLQAFGTLENYYKKIAEEFVRVIDTSDVLGIYWLDEYVDPDKLLDQGFENVKFKDGYKVTLDVNEFYKLKREEVTKTKDELTDILYEKLKEWFDGTEKEGNKVIIPICSHPTEKEDEVQS